MMASMGRRNRGERHNRTARHQGAGRDTEGGNEECPPSRRERAATKRNGDRDSLLPDVPGSVESYLSCCVVPSFLFLQQSSCHECSARRDSASPYSSNVWCTPLHCCIILGHGPGATSRTCPVQCATKCKFLVGKAPATGPGLASHWQKWFPALPGQDQSTPVIDKMSGASYLYKLRSAFCRFFEILSFRRRNGDTTKLADKHTRLSTLCGNSHPAVSYNAALHQ